MTNDKAKKIYTAWKEYVEFGDKLGIIFSSFPQSFLPYPAKDIEEALNIVAKSYFDSGDMVTYKNIQASLASTAFLPESDEKAIRRMKEELDFIVGNPELMKTTLETLKACRLSWSEFRDKH